MDGCYTLLKHADEITDLILIHGLDIRPENEALFAEVSSRIQEVARVFPALAPMLKRRADKLSGGERKMLAIGRVLMLDPAVLILDEPTANLSPKLADNLLRDHVRRLASLDKAVLLVEQRARAALQIAAWTLVLVSGATRLEGRPAELLERQDFEELFLGAGRGPMRPDPTIPSPGGGGEDQEVQKG